MNDIAEYQIIVNGDEYTIRRTACARFSVVYNIMTDKYRNFEWQDNNHEELVNPEVKAKRAIEKHILNQTSAHDVKKEHLQQILKGEDFWGDITNEAYVVKAKEFLWDNLSLKAKASVVYQANRDDIQAERTEKTVKPNRKEHSKKITGIAMSFIFEE